jgi:porphobilinogen synthase
MVDAKIEEMLEADVSSIMLFGIPEHKDEMGTQAYAEDGIIQRAVSYIKNKYPEFVNYVSNQNVKWY